MNQGTDHPKAGGQVSSMAPGTTLTQPEIQGMIKAGVFSQHYYGYTANALKLNIVSDGFVILEWLI
ncbi:hypothetical protein HC928_17240 [bacterium]|nr:hypothetical protein [bacterium]